MENLRSDSEVREDAPLAIDVVPTIHPRPGSRTFVGATGEYARWKLSRVGLTLDDAILEEVDDYLAGLGDATGEVADAYAREQPDVAIWEGERCLAVIRPRVGGDPEVTRFDDQGDDLPRPSTEQERYVWGLVKEHGAEVCGGAILDAIEQQPRPEPLTPALSPVEKIAVDVVRRLGEGESLDRLMLGGAYGVIADVIQRLESDAVDELRRIIAGGSSPVAVQAGEVLQPADPR